MGGYHGTCIPFLRSSHRSSGRRAALWFFPLLCIEDANSKISAALRAKKITLVCQKYRLSVL